MNKKKKIKTKKPWGYEILVETNKFYSVKKLFMKKGHRCSLQYHKKKIETIIVLDGELNIFINKKRKKFKPGSIITINNKIVHKMQAIRENCRYLECSSNHLKDVIRLNDKYGRC